MTASDRGIVTTREPPKTAEERLMVAVRVRPLQDDTHRVLHVLNEKVGNEGLIKSWYFLYKLNLK